MNSLPELRRMLIRKMVVDTAIPEKTIEKVIAHSFNGIVEALKSNDSVEISGFGKFEIKENIAKREIQICLGKIEAYKKQMEDPLMSDPVRKRREQWIEGLKEEIRYIKERGYGN